MIHTWDVIDSLERSVAIGEIHQFIAGSQQHDVMRQALFGKIVTIIFSMILGVQFII